MNHGNLQNELNLNLSGSHFYYGVWRSALYSSTSCLPGSAPLLTVVPQKGLCLAVMCHLVLVDPPATSPCVPCLAPGGRQACEPCLSLKRFTDAKKGNEKVFDTFN